MSVSRCYSILGDSNVKRHLNPMNCRDRPLMSGCQQVPCGKLALLGEALKTIRPESDVCLMSCVTNFITGSEDARSSVSFRIDPVLREFVETLNAVSASQPDRVFLVAPPMYRRVPLWYRDSLPEVLTKFSDIMKLRVAGIHLLPSFATPDFERDGIHLTAYSGLVFVLHLFDSAASVLSSLTATIPEAIASTAESSRVLEDRMMALEQDHRRLNRYIELKTAEDSEMFDFQDNVRSEICFMIAGLKTLPNLPPKEWQDLALKDVRAVLLILLGREPPIVFVSNATSRRKDAINTYCVQMKNLADSKEIRDTFGEFFVGFTDRRPPALKPFAIRNKVTPGTNVRVNIMKLLGERYKSSNPGSKFQVITYEPRPILKIYPASDAEDRRVQVYNYIQAVRSLPTNFSDEEIDSIIKKVSPKLLGRLRPMFEVISDDMVKKTRYTGKKSSGSAGASADDAGSGEGEKSGSSHEKSGSGNGKSSGKSSGSGKSSSRSRSLKRGASSDLGNAGKK